MEPVVRLDGSHFVSCPVDEYEALLARKVARLRILVECACGRVGLPEVEVFESPKSHFRMRANFNIWLDRPPRREEGVAEEPLDWYYAMFDPTVEGGKKRPVCEIKTFPRGTVFLNTLMDSVRCVLKKPEFAVLSKLLFEVRFVCTKTEQAVIVLLYHRPLVENWAELATKALDEINPDKSKHIVKLIGRSNKVKVVVGGEDDIIEEKLTVTQEGRFRDVFLYQTEGAFSQPNAAVCEKMLNWVLDITASPSWRERDLLELYCGGGTFTVVLCDNFRSVLATEISKASVLLAERCFKRNEKTNVKVARMSSEEFELAMSTTSGREFRRLAEKSIDVRKDFDFGTVFVDPPRAGLDPATCKLLTSFDNIIYISCNPETLARDIDIILKTGMFSVQRLAAFDQFPYTEHLEGGVFLTKTKKRKAKEE